MKEHFFLFVRKMFEDDHSTKNWDAQKLTSDNTGSRGNLEDEQHKSQTRLSYLDMDKELESKKDLTDNKELDIPQVYIPPTLESILNETDGEDEPFIPECPKLLNTESIETPPVTAHHWPPLTVVTEHTRERKSYRMPFHAIDLCSAICCSKESLVKKCHSCLQSYCSEHLSWPGFDI